MSTSAQAISAEPIARRPRLGFVGLGWIGRNRLAAVVQSELTDVCALYDPAVTAAGEGQEIARGAKVFSSFEELLDQDLDGVVIATPNRFHAEQSIAALERGIAVFCQKPLGRNASETKSIIAAARQANRVLGVDLSYRNLPAMKMVNWLVETGALGKVFAVDARFHNAYGPDKPWFYDFSLGGGGCLLDLGVHLLDLALGPLRFPSVTRIEGTLFSDGQVRSKGSPQIEDYAVATIETTAGAVINLSCSWNLHAGRDANFEISFYGSEGGASMRNVDGSFYDFVAERYHRTETTKLETPADSQWRWAGLATLEWVRKLSANPAFDPAIERLIPVAEIIDHLYGHEEAQQTQTRQS